MEISTISLDLAKSVFQVHGIIPALPLSKMRRAEVLTADRPWEQVAEAVGLTITLLR